MTVKKIGGLRKRQRVKIKCLSPLSRPGSEVTTETTVAIFSSTSVKPSCFLCKQLMQEGGVEDMFSEEQLGQKHEEEFLKCEAAAQFLHMGDVF